MNPGLLSYNDNLSNADGGWISGLFQLAGDAVKGGFAYGANKDTAKALIEQQRLAGQSATLQAGYGALGNDTASELLAATLGKSYDNPLKTTPPESSLQKNIVWLGLIAAATAIAIFIVLKTDNAK